MNYLLFNGVKSIKFNIRNHLAIFLFITCLFSQVQASNCNQLTKPTNLSVINNAGTAVTIGWDNVYGANSYQLQTYINGGYQQKTTSNNQATFSQLSQGYYYFNVVASNSCNEQSTPSEWFAVDVTGIAQCVPPSTPTNITQSNVTGNSFNVSWTNVTGADSYEIQRWNASSGWLGVATTSNSSYDFTGLTAGTEYIRIGAVNACGGSDFSNYISVVITGDINPQCPSELSKAGNLSASEISSNSFILSWSAVADADSYDVQLWQNGTWSTIANTTALSYQLTNINLNINQYVRIIARTDCDDNINSSSQWVSVIFDDTDVECPESLAKATDLVISNTTTNSFTVSWSSVNDADTYHIQLWQNNDWVTVATTNNSQYQLSDLPANSEQYVRIVAKVNCNESVSSESAWTLVKLNNNCPSQLDAPDGLTVNNIAQNSFSANWNQVTGATGYKVHIASNGTWQTLATQSTASKVFNNLNEGTYQVKVSAVCDNIESIDSSVKTIVISGPQSCNLPDVNGGIDISKYGESFDDFSVNGNLYVQGNGFNPSNYSMKVTCQGDYGHISNTTDYNDDNYVPFTYSYSHFGQRSSNIESVQFEVRSGGYMSRKTLSWNLNLGTQQSPVQPYCNDINIDEDVDGIPDCAEEAGKTFFGMPVHSWGARKNVTDLFIEVDYMSKASSGDHGTEPRKEVFDKVKAVFARQGYALHFDVGGLYGSGPENYNLGGGQAVQYSPWIGLSDWRNEYNGNHAVPGMKNNDSYPGVFSYMPVYFDNKPERARLFYYALFASSQAAGGEGSSGQAPDYFDYYFYVALGSPAEASKSRWFLNADNDTELNRMINSQSSVFMHELGHILGLSHGGWPDNYPNYEPNFKPNYTSIMNYAYALSGVPNDGVGFTENEMMQDRHYVGVRRDKNSACMALLEDKYGAGVSRRNFPGGLETDWQTYNLDFSYGNHASFNESNFNEAYVLGGLDLNCDGLVSNRNTAFNINYDTYAPDYVSGRYDNMRDFNDWDNIYLYYRHLNYSSDGKFLMSANLAAKNAIEPANVVPGAISSPQSAPLPNSTAVPFRTVQQTTRPIGVLEFPMSLQVDEQ